MDKNWTYLRKPVLSDMSVWISHGDMPFALAYGSNLTFTNKQIYVSRLDEYCRHYPFAGLIAMVLLLPY